MVTMSPPYSLCLAVSTSGDPLGTYNRWGLELSDNQLYDYPKVGR